MKRVLLICSMSLLISACASIKYGYPMEEWNNLTQHERDEIKTAATANAVFTQDKQREKEFVNRPINAVVGTRSNTY